MAKVITITHGSGDGTDNVFVDATCEDGEDVTLAEALGMLELAKALLIGQAT